MESDIQVFRVYYFPPRHRVLIMNDRSPMAIFFMKDIAERSFNFQMKKTAETSNILSKMEFGFWDCEIAKVFLTSKNIQYTILKEPPTKKWANSATFAYSHITHLIRVSMVLVFRECTRVSIF